MTSHDQSFRQRLQNKTHDQKSFEETLEDTHAEVFAGRLVEEQFRRSCKVRYEDELTKHGTKHIGTDGGKGEEFKMQDGMNGNRVGGGMNGDWTDSSEETGELTGMKSVVSDLICVWERWSFERLTQQQASNLSSL